MTAQETHPGLLAIDLQAKFVVTRNKARGLRDKAAGLRREAKTTNSAWMPPSYGAMPSP